VSSYRNIILIGYRACGKTTVGRALAERLRWTFRDTDEIIQRNSGRTIRAIFTEEGEAAFRDLEAEAVQSACAGRHQVISVGGGAILRAANRQVLRASGVVIWLTARPEEIHRRMNADHSTSVNRPALTHMDDLSEIEHVLAERTPLYAELADYTLDTDTKPTAAIVDALVAALPDAAGGSEASQ
jgi:shikimate kinase